MKIWFHLFIMILVFEREKNGAVVVAAEMILIFGREKNGAVVAAENIPDFKAWCRVDSPWSDKNSGPFDYLDRLSWERKEIESY